MATSGTMLNGLRNRRSGQSDALGTLCAPGSLFWLWLWLLFLLRSLVLPLVLAWPRLELELELFCDRWPPPFLGLGPAKAYTHHVRTSFNQHPASQRSRQAGDASRTGMRIKQYASDSAFQAVGTLARLWHVCGLGTGASSRRWLRFPPPAIVPNQRTGPCKKHRGVLLFRSTCEPDSE